MDILKDCTEEQHEAITHIDGPLMILAGAGSGKTRVITQRVAYLVSQGVAPENILAITFTNKAADEMRRRVEALVGRTGAWVSTFHSMCARILRQGIHHLGLDNSYTIYDEDDSRACIRRVMGELDMARSDIRPAAAMSVVSNAKTSFLSPEEFAKSASGPFYKAVARIYERYEAMLHEGSCLDFDDLLLFTHRLFVGHPDVLSRYAERFRYICIDEFQDTNRVQYLLAKALATVHKNICVVGDPDQTIYTWRGATLDNIFDFEKDFPGACVIKLEHNFRSTKSILRAASGLIKHNRRRKEKDLITENDEGNKVVRITAADEIDEAEVVVRAIRELCDDGRKYSDFAVLYRTNAQSRAFEQVMIENGMPYLLVGAVGFFRRREIKDMLAYVRLILNTGDDVSFVRVVGLSTKGVGPASLEKLRGFAQKSSKRIADVLLDGSYRDILSKRQVESLDKLRKILEDLRAMPRSPVQDIIKRVIELTGYRKQLRDASDPKTDERLENLDELVAAAVEYDGASEDGGLEGFMEQVALVSDTDNLDEGPDRVTLMTLHSVKGLEFPVVVITGLEEALMPHIMSMNSSEELEEERRLCFVGMTRAQERLILTHSLRRIRQGRYTDSLPSRFLAEIPPEAIEVSARTEGLIAPGARLGGLGRDKPITAEEGRDIYGINVGDYVEHKQFGTGKVIKLFRAGNQARARIFFPQYGDRLIVLEYADLERIGD